MRERPDALLAALLLTAAVAGGTLAGALVEIGGHGVLGLAEISVGILTACFLFAFEVRHLPPALVVTSVLAFGSAIAVARALLRIWREQRLLERLPGEAFASVPTSTGAIPVDVVQSTTANAFCVGLVRPRVIVTSGLLARLDEGELGAALMHEVEHARARGPLKVALAHVAARALFWLPAVGDLLDRFVLLSELAADRAAIAATSRAALAGALSEAIETPHPLSAVALADLAAPRIDRLFDESAELPPIFRRSSLLAGLAAIGAFVFVLACSPHLGLGESTQLHAMTVNLLAHRLHARLIGLGETAAALAICVAVWRRLAPR
jgi:hypothetical protein